MDQFDTFLFDLGDWVVRNFEVFIFGTILLVFIYLPLKFLIFILRCLFIDSFWKDWNKDRQESNRLREVLERKAREAYMENPPANSGYSSTSSNNWSGANEDSQKSDYQKRSEAEYQERIERTRKHEEGFRHTGGPPGGGG